MSDELSESAIVRAVAEQAAQRVTRQVIAALQRMKHTLSGDDSELKTTWDEICVQVQQEESFFWDTYDETVRTIVGEYVNALPKHDREAIWLQTSAGCDWGGENTEEREACPVSNENIVEYLIHEYVYSEACRWSNARIRAYIEWSSMRD